VQLIRCTSTSTYESTLEKYSLPPSDELPNEEATHLNPPPDHYSLTPFTDRCTLTLQAGAGGHGCVSFLREKYIEYGPANGGDGGSGGNIFIQALKGESSLHRVARKPQLKAGRGRNGRGSTKGGDRGEDILITVPIGTVIREVWRDDPMIEEEERWQRERRHAKKGADGEGHGTLRPERWLLHPGMPSSTFATAEFPLLPRPRRSHLAAIEPKRPIRLDLDAHMERPVLFAAGSMGGLGNPHFVTQDRGRPKFATRGDEGMKLVVQLELKLLADVGLVGLPNAGKSTLLRSLSKSRARVGSWAFTTLQPNIGTVVLDDYKGRVPSLALEMTKKGRTRFTIADIPGLIEDAHKDKGLGFSFLRHVERAAVLAFVVDLSAGDAVRALKALWKEVGEYESLTNVQLNLDTEERLVNYKPAKTQTPLFDENGNAILPPDGDLPPLSMPPITAKPWFVVGTKADLPETQENFKQLQSYVKRVQRGTEEHPSGRRNAWRERVEAVPVSAINAEGVKKIPEVVLGLLST